MFTLNHHICNKSHLAKISIYSHLYDFKISLRLIRMKSSQYSVMVMLCDISQDLAKYLQVTIYSSYIIAGNIANIHYQ